MRFGKLMRAIVGVLAIVLIVTMPARSWSADLVETVDGRRLSGVVTFANGAVVVTGKENATRLNLDQVKSLGRDETKPRQPDRPTGLMAEFFSDAEWKQSCAVMPHPAASFDWNGQPNPYTPEMFSVRLTGHLTPTRTGSYRFRSQGYARILVGDQTIANDAQVVRLEAGMPVPVLLEFRKTQRVHVRGVLLWAIDKQDFEAIAPAVLSPPEEMGRRAEDFHQQRLATSSGGLKGEYFLDESMREPKLVRLDSVMSIDWQSPGALVPGATDRFFARWTGKLRSPKTGQVRLSTSGASRLWIDHKLVIDRWDLPNAKDKPEHVTLEMSEGKLYDVRLEVRVSGKGWGQFRFNWNGQFQWMPSLPGSVLIPPPDMPRVFALSPRADAEVSAASPGFEVHAVATPGVGASIAKVELFEGKSPTPIAVSMQAPYKLLARLPYVGATTVRARVTNSAGVIANTDPINVIVTDAPADALGGRWSVGRVGEVAPPAASLTGGRLEIRGTRGEFGATDRLPVVSHALRGDGEILARLVKLEAGKPDTVAMAGLTMRRQIRDQGPHLTLLGLANKGWVISRPSGQGIGRHDEVKMPSAPVWMRILRDANTVTAYWSVDGREWTAVHSVDIGIEPQVIAALTAYAANVEDTATAVFDHVTVRSGSPIGTVHSAGLQLVSGTIRNGAVKVEDGGGEISLVDPSGQSTTYARDRVARIFYGPTRARVLSAIAPGARGAIVRGADLLEGDVTQLTSDRVTITSVLFGISELSPQSGALSAVLLNDVAPTPLGAWVVQHTNGIAVATEASVQGDTLTLRMAGSEELRVRVSDVQAIARNSASAQ